jgi:hypothetical protein
MADGIIKCYKNILKKWKIFLLTTVKRKEFEHQFNDIMKNNKRLKINKIKK